MPPNRNPKTSPATFRGEMFFPDWLQLYVNRNEEGFENPLHNHDFVEFVYIAEGRGFHHIENDVHSVKKGDFCLIPIGVPHVFRPTGPNRSGQPLVVYNCLASVALLDRLRRSAFDPAVASYISSLGGPGFAYASGRDRDGTIERLFLDLYREFSFPREGAADLLCSLLMRLIITVRRELEHAEGAAVGAAGRTPGDFAALLSYVERHAHVGLTLAELAAVARWSQRHLARMFRRHTGQTFHAYVQNVRMRQSCELLRSTDWKVSAVAAAVGYKDIDAFNGAFKRFTGVTPTKFRKEAAADATL